MGATTSEKKKCSINKNLITLKLVVFFVFIGIANIHIVHTYYHKVLGLYFSEYRLISILTPLISTIGPLLAGPLADRLAARNANTYGRSLRFLTAFFLILASIFYGCILCVDSVDRYEARKPLVSFGCDSTGAVIFQERCTESRTCHHWSKEKMGSLILTNCSYTCQKPSQYEFLYTPWTKGSPIPPTTDISSDSDWDHDYDEGGGAAGAAGLQTTTESMTRIRRDLMEENSVEVFSVEEMSREKREVPRVYVNPPHLCIKTTDRNNEEKIEKCHVYTDDTDKLVVQATLRSATNKENDTHSADWCNYPLDGFQCDIPDQQVEFMTKLKNHSACKPMMECEVIDPYESPDSVLADSLCITTIGDADLTFWGYFALRFIGEIFPLAALTLLNTAIVIATRETSTGRGEVCRQYVFGSIAWVLTICDYGIFHVQNDLGELGKAMTIIAIIGFIIAAIILLFASSMPLSPPEWWWHTKTGMLVYPMSAIRKYGPEIFALTLICLILGMFFGSIHTYLYWVYRDYYGITFLSLLLVLLLFFNVDKFIEYCGHSNILIATFTYYIIRFTAIAIKDDAEWLVMITEIFEPLIISVSWITIILYMRHIIPRKFTATGQALAVIAHFCIGKSLGALIGLIKHEKYPERSECMYRSLAIAACVIALIYFILYNLVLAPRCAAKAQPATPTASGGSGGGGGGGGGGSGGSPQPQNGSATNGANGNYTPLRVYHNERGKKGQFRY